MNNRFRELLEEEKLKAKYKLKVITKDGFEYDKIAFTSITDFKYFLDSNHYDKITCYSDDRIIVMNKETDEIVFDTDKGD